MEKFGELEAVKLAVIVTKALCHRNAARLFDAFAKEEWCNATLDDDEYGETISFVILDKWKVPVFYPEVAAHIIDGIDKELEIIIDKHLYHLSFGGIYSDTIPKEGIIKFELFFQLNDEPAVSLFGAARVELITSRRLKFLEMTSVEVVGDVSPSLKMFFDDFIFENFSKLTQ